MSETRQFRTYIIDSGDPMTVVNLNQASLKHHLSQTRKLDEPRKSARARRRKERFFAEAIKHEEAKTERVERRVRAVIYGGYDGTNPQVLTAELKFLARRGIVFGGY